MRSSLLASLLCASLAAQTGAPQVALRPACEWLSAHGYPDLARSPFVATTAPGGSKGHAFLVAAEEGEARVLTTDGIETTLRTAEGQRWEAASFDEFVRKRLQRWKTEPGAFSLRRTPRPMPSHATSFLLIACAADQRGDRTHLAELTAAAKALYGDHSKSLVELLGEDLSRVALWTLTLDFADPDVSWAEIERRSAAFVRRYGDCRLAQVASRWQKVTARMVSRNAPDAEADPLARMVFELRDQRGAPDAGPGSFDVFADPRGDDSPAARLAAAGERAIPFLLPALESDDLTRCVAYHSPTFFSHRVLTLGEVTRQVFTRITGYAPSSRADAERFWRDLGERGAVTVYADGAAAGNVEQARRLALLAPEVALAALTEALASLPADRHADLLEILGRLDDRQVDEILLRQLRASPSGEARFVAAMALGRHGHGDKAIEGLIAAWSDRAMKNAHPAIGRFLAGCGRRSALEALFSRPERIDNDLFDLLAEVDPTSNAAPPEMAAELRWIPDRVEDGWAEALERHLGELAGKGRFDQRVHAAEILARRWPDIYVFDTMAPIVEMRKALERIEATWSERFDR